MKSPPGATQNVSYGPGMPWGGSSGPGHVPQTKTSKVETQEVGWCE